MKQFLTGFLAAALIASIALNAAQYSGSLSAPMMAKIQPTDEEQLASILQ